MISHIEIAEIVAYIMFFHQLFNICSLFDVYDDIKVSIIPNGRMYKRPNPQPVPNITFLLYMLSDMETE